MGSEWNETTWGRLATLEYGKSLRDYSNGLGGYRVFGTNGAIGWHDTPLCNNPGIIIGRKGAYRGVHYSPEPFFVIDTAFYLKPKVEMDTKWAYYQLRTQDINGMDSGSAIPSTSRDDFYGLPVLFPPISEQKAIAHILGTLDDKIELNRRMNQTLEGMARAIFKSWFVDFDPVRAKAAGKKPTGLSSDIAKLFPNSFEDSDLGEIPKGWTTRPLRDLADVIMGTSPPGDTYNDAGIGTSLINGPVEFGERFPTKSKWTTADVRLARRGDLIFCVRGSTTGRRVYADDTYGLGRGVCAIRGRDGDQAYVNSTIEAELPRLLSKATGSVFPSLSAPDLKDFRVLRPSDQVMSRFCSCVDSFQEKANLLSKEATTLASIRDALLPKLMSGELRVPDAERIAARCS